MEAVVCDVEQTQCGAGHGSRCHSGVLIKAQEQLLKPGKSRSILVESSHTRETFIKYQGSDQIIFGISSLVFPQVLFKY